MVTNFLIPGREIISYPLHNVPAGGIVVKCQSL